jgi:hypothetical protein
MAKVTLNDIVSQYGNVSLYNSNNTSLEDALNSGVLWRDNPIGEANQMENDLDMNSYRIINGGAATSDGDYITLAQVVTLINSVVPFYGNEIVTVSTTTYTLDRVLNAGKYLIFTNASGCAVTVPPDEFTLADEVHFRSATDGAVTFVEGSGVTIQASPVYDTDYALYGNGGTATLKLVGTNTWDIFGLLALA